MAWGMRIKRDGVTEMDPFTNMGRIIGRVNTGGTNGSVADDGLLTGSPEWQVVSLNGAPLATPTISVSGNVLSWTYPTGGLGGNTPVIIVYWVR
jgi:hypothetical protein